MAGERYMEVNWGRENGGVAEGKEPFPWRDKGREKKRIERVWCQVCTRGKPFWTTDWGARSTECFRFICKQHLELKLKRFWKCTTSSGAELWRMLLRRRQLVLECLVWCRNLRTPWETTFPFLEYFWKMVYCLSKDKRPCGHKHKAFHWQGTEAHPEGI